LKARIAINGFGRIGRMCLRASLGRKDIDVVAINGTMDPTSLARLLKYDSVHGMLDRSVTATDKEIVVDGKPIRVLSDRNPANLPWASLGVDIVIESTGKFNKSRDCQVHLDNGAGKVIITAPAKDSVPTFVVGVNDGDYDHRKHHIVSTASCTTNCLAPVVKVLHEKFGIVSGFMSTVHAFTTDQRSLDNSHKDPRRARGCTQSIIPTTTGAAKMIGEIIPELKGKLNGIAIRVPVPNVSLTDLVVQVERKVTVEEINAALCAAANGPLKGVMDFCEEPLVSVDFLKNSHSAIVDALSTMVVGPNTVKVLAWYDNEWGYACRVIDFAELMARQAAVENKNWPTRKAAG
jgi:glyceraldehyde 3-phosphate dehydrogenase